MERARHDPGERRDGLKMLACSSLVGAEWAATVPTKHVIEP
jgi:hypothetical protein